MPCRVQAYIKNGWADALIDTDGTITGTDISSSNPTNDDAIFPKDLSWNNIKTYYKSPSEVPKFTNADIVTYFVMRKVCDGSSCTDFKSINQSAIDLFHCGHLQQVEIAESNATLWIQANCLLQMRKDRTYKVVLSLSSGKWDIIGASCGCPAGKGPRATCKHIGGLCYWLQSFCENGTMPEFFTCTQRLQEWNKPRGRKVESLPVTDLKEHKITLNVANLNRMESSRIPSNFDPRPANMRSVDLGAVDILRADLLNIGHACAFTTILVPSVERALHDHTYSKILQEDALPSLIPESQSHQLPASPRPTPQELQPLRLPAPDLPEQCRAMKENLLVSARERMRIEEITRMQSECSAWYEVRQKRITGWKCGQILTQKSRTPALLKNILYTKPMCNVPAPIKWGQENECTARQAYVKYMQMSGQVNLTVRKCGFIIRPERGWLGSSPDGVVLDTADKSFAGLLELKCPYTKEACQDPNFYCSLSDNDSIILKRAHAYYHQIQLQLYVSSDMYKWCDFCVYTTKGILTERIYPDSK